jgi:hypothetical protein
MDIISMAQHASPNVMGHNEFFRAQFNALSSVVVMILSPVLTASSSARANNDGGWLSSNASESPTP